MNNTSNADLQISQDQKLHITPKSVQPIYYPKREIKAQQSNF